MKTVKEEVIDILKVLPDEAGYDDIMSEIYFKQRVDQSLKQVQEGKTISHETVKEKMSKWIK